MTWTNIPFAHNSFVIWVLSDRHCIRRPRSMHGISDIEKWGIKIKNTERGKCAGIHKKDLSRVLHYLLWQIFEWKRLSMTVLAVTSRFLNFAAVFCWPLCDQKLKLFPLRFRQLIPLTWLSDNPQGHKKGRKRLKRLVQHKCIYNSQINSNTNLNENLFRCEAIPLWSKSSEIKLRNFLVMNWCAIGDYRLK